MNTQTISIFKPSWKQIVVAIFASLYIAINIFQIGGDAFVINLNNFVVMPLALGVTVLALILLRQMVKRRQII